MTLLDFIFVANIPWLIYDAR